MAKFLPYNLGFMGYVYGLVVWWLVLAPPNERADPRQNSQRVAARVRLPVRSSNLLLRPQYRFVD
jgi:hypothetical protein